MVNSEDITQVLCLIIAVTSIVGNSLVCHVIIRRKSMKTGMNYLLLNLALLDTITGFLGIFKIIIDSRSSLLGTSNLLEQVYNKNAITAEVLCKVLMSFWIGRSVTPLFLMAMAYERYMAVVHPLTRRTGGVSKARLKWISAVCWLSGLAFVIFETVVVIYHEGICGYAAPFWFSNKVYDIVLVSVQFVIPSIAIFVLYFRVIKALRTTQALGVQGEAQNVRNKARRKVVFIVITVTVIFYVFTGIPHVFYVLYEVFGINTWVVQDASITVLLFTINSVSNPLVYFTLMKTFRDCLLELICRRGRGTRRENSTLMNTISRKQHDNELENEPKLLRISASATL